MISISRVVSQKRWWIVGLLLLATILNYLDRQSLSILATTIQKAFGMNDYAYGHVVFAFLLAYTAAYALSGPFCDRFSVRASMAFLMIWWSTAELLPAFVHSAVALGVSRLLLGIGEAGVWIVAPKAVGLYFPVEQRGTAIGIYTSGATLGAAIAPPLIALLAIRHGWQSVFVVTGLAGLLWVAPWLVLVRDTPGSPEPKRAVSLASIRSLVKRPNLWLLLLARLITDPVWYFYLFWYPKFLGEARHLSLARIGRTAWVVYLAADIGAITGGWASGWLMRRGIVPLRARRIVMTAAACVFPLSPLVAMVSSASLSSGLAAAIAFAHLSWMITLTAIAVDLFPEKSFGTAFGLISAGSGVGGLLSAEIIPHILQASGYFPLFIVMGMLHPLALFMIWRLREKIPAFSLVVEAI
ncbi:MAG TPA: MFS transporter [Terriglobia bacterium]|nr:MFS transporter [Terriglobia bacterium]